MANIGNINLLKVLRKTDIGFMLEADDEEIFLHNNETLHRELKDGEEVAAFLYYDEKQRVAATLHTPLITSTKADFVEVADIHPKLGAFLNMGINKDLLLSLDDLPQGRAQWPKVGDLIYAKILVKNRLVARIPTLPVDHEQVYENGDKVTGYIQKASEVGLNIYTKDLKDIFVHKSMYRGTYRIGQKVDVRVTHFSELGYSGSLMPQKENLRIDDAEIIYAYLLKHKRMPLTAKSNATAIKPYFEMSRKAFKRALGHLYRERLVKFEDDETILVGEE